MKQKEDAHYQTVLGLIERPKRLLATILIANNFLSIAVIISTDLLFNSLINMQALFPNHEPQFYTLLNILIQVVLVTFSWFYLEKFCLKYTLLKIIFD